MPSSAVERLILQTFRQVLEQPDMTLSGDFFNLGGNSVAAVEIAETISAKLGRDIQAAMILIHSCPADLAQHIISGSTSPNDRAVTSGA